ncbi:serine/threonine-protein kinase [Nonomuraea sp. NPDC048826]|uniref:serine/threonine-protein kinase n=1 Tax=Nonomuraea sp. NPDC048826 TaxID=3364347 RepID=UPI00371E1282
MARPLTPDDPAELGGFRLTGRLGEGGQGVVYLAHSPAGEPVAIKLLSTGDRETRTRLARELEALESIASFCTARVLHASTDGPRPYVISEFIDGPSLAERVVSRGPLAGGNLERVAVGTATALAAIHAAGVVHRDFKPANVLLGPDGPRVVDFGIARAEGAATMTSGLIGTPAYLAPEQIGGTPASPASDVFAWAATVLFAATGVSPFGADTVPAVLHRVLHAEPDLRPLPPRLRGPIAAALAKDPSRRPTAQSLMVRLVNPDAAAPYEQVTDGHPARPDGPRDPGGSGPSPGGSWDPGRSGPGPGAPWDPGRDAERGGSGGPGRTGPGAPALTTGPGRRRSGAVLAGVLAVVVALAAGGAALLWTNRAPILGALGADGTATPGAVTTASTTPTGSPEPRTGEPGQTGESTPAGEPTEAGEPTPEASAGDGNARIPAAFAGTWKGTADSEMMGKKFDDEPVTITLKQGENTGTWHSPGESAGCQTGTLQLTQVSGSTLTFRLGGLGDVCAVFESAGGLGVTLERTHEDRADYELTMPLGGKSEGELRRTR